MCCKFETRIGSIYRSTSGRKVQTETNQMQRKFVKQKMLYLQIKNQKKLQSTKKSKQKKSASEKKNDANRKKKEANLLQKTEVLQITRRKLNKKTNCIGPDPPNKMELNL